MNRVFCFLLGLMFASCSNDPPQPDYPLTRLKVDRTYLKDDYGRYVFFHGVNVSGSTKVPMSVGGRFVTTESFGEPLNKGKPSYLGLPFPGHIGKAVSLDEIKGYAREEFKKLKADGFNAVRLLINWEGVEPERKGEYDEDYLESIRQVVESANEYGIYVLLDMHQDAFSRHLIGGYNEQPWYEDPPGSGNRVYPPPGSIENTILALLPPYTDTVRGEGAPRWAVEACLQEKNMDAPSWGIPRIVGLLDRLTLQDVTTLAKLAGAVMGGEGGGGSEVPPWVIEVMNRKPDPFKANEVADVIPFTNWGIAAMLSLDVARCFFCMFASEKAFPGLMKDGVSVKEYLQDAYAKMWQQVAAKVRDLPNVIGYDIMNEPITNAIVLSAVGAVIMTGALEGAEQTLVDLLGKENGELAFHLITGLGILPPIPQKPVLDDCSGKTGTEKDECERGNKEKLAEFEEEKARVLWEYGLDKLDPMAIIGFNYGFDRDYLKPFYERVGKAILEVDKDAVIFIESSLNFTLLFTGSLFGVWDVSMDKLDLPRVVYAPHWYTDIYPFIGINQADREFQVEEVRYRDYEPSLRQAEMLASYSLGNVPVVFGEFGTYFKFGGIDESIEQNYLVSAHILDNYYEAFERMFRSRFVWCYTPDNDKRYGDLWNKEDFSIYGFDKKPRAREAWARPFPRALAGLPISMHYYSPLHYFDLSSKIVPPYGEFEVRYRSKETSAPTEIAIPEGIYPDGFYVWVSDGLCYYDYKGHVLYHYPAKDEPDAEHFVRILPPLKGQEMKGWRYFFKDEYVIRAY